MCVVFYYMIWNYMIYYPKHFIFFSNFYFFFRNVFRYTKTRLVWKRYFTSITFQKQLFYLGNCWGMGIILDILYVICTVAVVNWWINQHTSGCHRQLWILPIIFKHIIYTSYLYYFYIINMPNILQTFYLDYLTDILYAFRTIINYFFSFKIEIV